MAISSPGVFLLMQQTTVALSCEEKAICGISCGCSHGCIRGTLGEICGAGVPILAVVGEEWSVEKLCLLASFMNFEAA